MIGKIYRAQAPVITAVTRVAQIFDGVTASMVAKQEFTDHRNELRLMLKPRIQTPYSPQSTLPMAQNSDILTSGVIMSYSNYYFLLGRILLRCGWRSKEIGRHVANEESLLAGHWEFEPASWVTCRSIRIQARLLVQFGEYSKPRITPSLTFKVMCLDLPVWHCIWEGDSVGVRRHLSTGYIEANDTTLFGETLLSRVSRNRKFQFCHGDISGFTHSRAKTQIFSRLHSTPNGGPTRRARYFQILQLLVESGAEGEGRCNVEIGPKKYVSRSALDSL